MGSFGNEIKDFINAFDKGQKMVASRDDREYKRARTQFMKAKAANAEDPEIRDLAKSKLQAQIDRLKRGPQVRPMHPLQEQLLRSKLDYYKGLANPPAQPSPAGSAAPMVGPQSALDVGGSYDTAMLDEPEAVDNAQEEADEDTMYGAVGGMVTRKGNKPKAIKVKAYADGGVVEDDEEDTTAPADDVAYGDEDGDVVEPDDDSDDVGGAVAPAQASAEKPAFSYQAAHDAALAGVKYSMAHHAANDSVPPQGAVATEELSAAPRRSATRAHASGEGAVSLTEMQGVMKAIDPDNKLSESERNMAALAHVYEWTAVNKGPEAAERAAGSMTQFMRQVSDRYRALAEVAASNGDVNGTVKNIARAYANVPDGRDLKFSKSEDGRIKATFVDEQSGKEVEKYIVSPDQLLQWATKGGIQNFDSLLARSAAGREELKGRKADAEKADEKIDKKVAAAKKDVMDERKTVAAETVAAAKAKEADMKANAPLKPSDRKIVREEIDTAVSEDPEAQKTLGPQFKEIVSTAKQIGEFNGRIDGATAVRAAREMTQVDPANPSARNFDYALDEKTGNLKVTLGNGQTIVVPKDTAVRLGKLRAENAKKAQEALDKAKAAGERGQSNINAGKGVLRSMAGNPQPMRGVPVLGRQGFGNSVPLDEAPPGSVPYRGLGER